MKKTGDEILDAVLKNYRQVVRPRVQNGHSIDYEKCLDSAIAGAWHDLGPGHSRFSIGEHIRRDEATFRRMCQDIELDIMKRGKLLDIRKTSVGPKLDEYIAASGLNMRYRLRDNNSAVLSTKMSNGQTISFSVSYSRIMSGQWFPSLQADLLELEAILDRLGRIRIKTF